MGSSTATVEQRLLPLVSIRNCTFYLPRSQVAVHHPRTPGTLPCCQLSLCGRRGSNNRVMSQQQHCQPLMSLTSSKKNVIKANGLAKLAPTQKPQLQDVVIVGGGIAGLATALALHRLGVKSVLLEQSEQLRTAGSSIGIWTNAWRALEALEVADSLRKKFVKLSGAQFFGEDGSLILDLRFDDASRDVEFRGVERKLLLETLREALPDDTVLYDSQVVGIKKIDGGYTEVECENGRTIQTKVLIGCDGIGSVVAKWMNMGKPRYAGYTITRGLAVYPDGHKLIYELKQILGRGVRAGILPIDSNSVYWFVAFNSSDERLEDVELVREEVLKKVKGWPSMITEAISRSPSETVSRRGISDRWMWPVGGSPLYKGGVTLAGDAMHPMTPNLAQGGCCALEDAVILARALSKALSTKNSPPLNGSLDNQMQEVERIELALKSYTEERWPRMLHVAIRSYVIGVVFQFNSEFFSAARNKLLPKIVNVDRFISHSFYDCGTM